jgi:hypothetical protein
VDQGRVVALTAKTGHYWTTPELMLSMARRLRGIPEIALIRPDVLDSANGRGVQFYRMRDYVVNGAKATSLDRSEIRRSLPTWVQSSELERQLQKAPASPEEFERVPAPQTRTLSVEEKKAQGTTTRWMGKRLARASREYVDEGRWQCVKVVAPDHANAVEGPGCEEKNQPAKTLRNR